MPSKIPFEFVIESLTSLNPRVKPMFGSFAVYVGEKIMLVLRDRERHEEAKGVWLATSKEHHASLKKDFPSMCSVYILSDGKTETEWQMLPLSSDDFESTVNKACEFILRGDTRIGRIPKPRKKRSKKV
ncbi:MAG: hypothetical protein JJE25_02705 [Bacteroidia bacterium]|nr:hypothetical protein [Bacteroidia bacterium]